MAEPFLDGPVGPPEFHEHGCVGVAQRMNIELFIVDASELFNFIESSIDSRRVIMRTVRFAENKISLGVIPASKFLPVLFIFLENFFEYRDD